MGSIKINDRLILRELRISDAADIFNAIDSQREYLGRWLPFVAYTGEIADSKIFVRSVVLSSKENRELHFAIRYDGIFAGLIGFKDTDKTNLKTEIGYWLSEPFQHKGIMTSSVRALCGLAFNTLGLNRVQIKCAVGNIPSRNIPKRLGFTLEGTERGGELFPDGTFANLEIYSLLSSEFLHSGYET